jgi:hypothetical protein
MRIPTTNVIIGFDRKIMERFFSNGATYTSLLKGLSLSGQDTLLFDNESNPNFISFEHSLNFGTGMRMKLEFIDPKGQFEERYISDNIIKNIAGFEHNDPGNKDIDSFSEEINKQVEESQKEYSKENFLLYANEYKKHFGTKEIYVAYGSGENLNLWSGPHRTILQGVDIDVAGPRKITITLVPTDQALQMSHRRGAYNELVNLNLAGLRMQFRGQSKKIKFATPEGERSTALYSPLHYYDLGENYSDDVEKDTEELKSFLQNADLADLASNLGDFDFHSMIVDALRNYIQQATNNPNVIVLLPNINLICRKYLNEMVKNSRSTLSIAKKSLEITFGSFEKSSESKNYSIIKQKELAKKEWFVSYFLQSFNCNLYSQSKISNYLAALPNFVLGKFLYTEKKKDSVARGKDYFLNRDFYAVLEQSDSGKIPDHMKLVKGVLNKIKLHSKEEYQLVPAYFSETDTSILNFWSTKKGEGFPCSIFPTLGGYDNFNAEKEAIIVGDLALIQNYLYSKINYEKALTSISEYKNQAVDYKGQQETHETYFPKPQNPYQDFLKPESKYITASKGFLSAAAKEIPLHPLDKILLTNSQYRNRMRSYVFPKYKKGSSGAFGDTAYLPDVFAYEDVNLSKKQKKYIQDNNIPVFRYNTQNPNVIDINFKFGSIYFANLLMGFKKTIERKASGVAAGILPVGNGSFPIRTKGDAIAYVKLKEFTLGLDEKERNNYSTELAALMTPDLVSSIGKSTPEEAADWVATFIKESKETKYKGHVLIDQLLPGNPQSIMTDFMEETYRKALQMQIKTLPTFHLSNIYNINTDTLVFAQDAKIAQTSPPERTLINSFYSGIYKIMGFRHIINSGSAHSEFKLVKNVAKYNIEEESREDL